MKRWLALFFCLASGAAQAQNGPLSIDADKAELDEQRGVSIYSGDVRLTQGNLTLTGQQLTIRRVDDDDNIRATMRGEPAVLTQGATPGQAAVTATAGNMTYETANRRLLLESGAELRRGEDVLTAERIEYSVDAQRMQASGTGNERVRITIPAPTDVPASLQDSVPADMPERMQEQAEQLRDDAAGGESP
ncbi:lipopolysaccharide transport periplasmic protein LptA [bacterium]|nr:lipopolysaccharide transport periplasmic protein LptA [bacterium]